MLRPAVRSLAVATLAIAIANVRSLAAQDPGAEQRVARARAALAPIAALAGQWEGDAQVTGPGGAARVRQYEDVVWGAKQTVMMVRGTGRSTEAGAGDSVVFEAAAIAWGDPESGKVRLRTYRDGREVETDVKLRPDTLEWGFPVQGGYVRYVIAFGNDTWHEVGHFERSGGGRFPIVEMRLRRKR